MRPLAVLLGIVMGSTVSIAIGLAMTLVVFLFLPEYSARVDAEFAPLLRMLVVTVLLALSAVASFYGELRGLAWRRAAHGALVLFLVAVAVFGIPRG
jgi:magnesium-transporting ATPase (P-type)